MNLPTHEQLCDGVMFDAANGSCWSCSKCAWYDDHGPAPHRPVPKPPNPDDEIHKGSYRMLVGMSVNGHMEDCRIHIPMDGTCTCGIPAHLTTLRLRLGITE